MTKNKYLLQIRSGVHHSIWIRGADAALVVKLDDVFEKALQRSNNLPRRRDNLRLGEDPTEQVDHFAEFDLIDPATRFYRSRVLGIFLRFRSVGFCQFLDGGQSFF